MINLSGSPYFNDFYENDNNVEVLFKPALNVQTRELNCLQSISSSQTKLFANHFYNNGSMISGSSPERIDCAYIIIHKSYDLLALKEPEITLVKDDVTATVFFIKEHNNFLVVYLNYHGHLTFSYDDLIDVKVGDESLFNIEVFNHAGLESALSTSSVISTFIDYGRVTDVVTDTIDCGLLTDSISHFDDYEYLLGLPVSHVVTTLDYNHLISPVTFEDYGHLTDPTLNYRDYDYLFFNDKPECNVVRGSTILTTPPVTGYGTLWKSQGRLFYFDGNFIQVSPQVIVGDDFSLNAESYMIGYYTRETIIKEINDSSLYDNSNSTIGYMSKGAHRYKYSLELLKYPYTDIISKNFFPIVKVNQEGIKYLKNRTEYSDIMNTLEERDYDDSGNFSLSKINATCFPGNNFFNFKVVVNSFLAYINGRRVETFSESSIVTPLNFASENTRIDYLCIDDTGKLNVVIGSPSTNHILPAVDRTKNLVIAEIYQDGLSIYSSFFSDFSNDYNLITLVADKFIDYGGLRESIGSSYDYSRINYDFADFSSACGLIDLGIDDYQINSEIVNGCSNRPFAEIIDLIYSMILSKIKIVPVHNKVYRVKDLHRLVNRVDNIEYYTAFSLLEQEANNASIKDELGFEQFKNGIMVDDFTSFQIGDYSSHEFLATYNRSKGSLIPRITPVQTVLSFDPENSVGVIKVGNSLMLDFDEEYFYYQTSKTSALNLSSVIGYDSPEVTVKPSFSVKTDLSNTILTTYHDSVYIPKEAIDNVKNVDYSVWTSSTLTENGNNNVYDVEVRTFIPEMTIEFNLIKARRNTLVSIFFDDKNVTDLCHADGGLITNNTGQLNGTFNLPANTFFSGTKRFTVKMGGITSDCLFYSGANTLFTVDSVKSYSEISDLFSESNALTTMNKYATVYGQVFKNNSEFFITSVDLFLPSPTDGLKVYVCETLNGEPTKNIIVSGIFAHTDYTGKVIVKFDFPCYVKGDFSIVIESLNASVYIIEDGKKDLISDEIVENSDDVALYEFNGSWTEVKNTSLSIIIHRARFKSNSGIIYLSNYEYKNSLTGTNLFKTVQDTNKIEILHPCHAMRIGDLAKPILAENIPLLLNPKNKVNLTGKYIISDTGIAKIFSVKDFTIKLTEFYGYYTKNQNYKIVSLTRDDVIAVTNKIKSASDKIADADADGTIGDTFGFSQNELLFGSINQDLEVVEIVDRNSFIVELPLKSVETANITGLIGGFSAVAANSRYDAFSVNSSYLKNNCSIIWSFMGLDAENDSERTIKGVEFGKINYLDNPNTIKFYKNEVNESILLWGEITTANTLLSPIFSDNSFVVSAYANRIDYNDSSNYDFSYVTKDIKLINESFDMKIYLDVLKPAGTDYDVFIKKLGADDLRQLDEIEWVKLVNENPRSADRLWKDFNSDDFTEITIQLSKSMPSYFKGGFNRFKVKVVGTSNNTSRVPMFKALRVITTI